MNTFRVEILDCSYIVSLRTVPSKKFYPSFLSEFTDTPRVSRRQSAKNQVPPSSSSSSSPSEETVHSVHTRRIETYCTRRLQSLRPLVYQYTSIYQPYIYTYNCTYIPRDRSLLLLFLLLHVDGTLPRYNIQRPRRLVRDSYIIYAWYYGSTPRRPCVPEECRLGLGNAFIYPQDTMCAHTCCIRYVM